MASYLYRAGAGHIVDGIECEVVLVEYDQYEAHLSAGWSPNLPGAKVLDADGDGTVEADEVRAAAKAAGIEGLDTKRIKTLRAALEA